jgi:hypothetical protein
MTGTEIQLMQEEKETRSSNRITSMATQHPTHFKGNVWVAGPAREQALVEPEKELAEP